MKRRHFVSGLAAAGVAIAAAVRGAHRVGAGDEAGDHEARLGFGLDPVFAPHIVAMQKGWLRMPASPT